MLIAVALAEYALINNFNIEIVLYQFGLLALYIFLVTAVRAMNVSIFVYKMKKHEYMTNLLEELQGKKL